eukprot:TRINITY_DN66417_c0_g1_i1.p1 TRINITY_DN66417_c0_g1~~TRINITY_DN66417_c0_g1_i1.p1  ORF type:complete len:162 (+),score=28.51 TRINITY_DN66417_c0_g1_i1:69-488(+)
MTVLSISKVALVAFAVLLSKGLSARSDTHAKISSKESERQQLENISSGAQGECAELKAVVEAAGIKGQDKVIVTYTEEGLKHQYRGPQKLWLKTNPETVKYVTFTFEAQGGPDVLMINADPGIWNVQCADVESIRPVEA